MSVAWVGAGIAAVGTVASASSARSGQKAQAAGVSEANALSRDQYNQTRADQRPFMQAGVAANNKLALMMGTPADPYATAGGIRYDTNNPFASPEASAEYQRLSAINGPEAALQQIVAGWNHQINPVSDAEYAAFQASQKSDPEYGSLLRQFGQSDLDADTIYQNTYKTALENGNRGIERQAAASGNLLSGATLKALSRFGAETAATYGNDAYNRFNTNQTNKFNRLASLSGAGQQANSQVQASGQNYANTVGSNLVGLGNARAASSVAQGNAIANGIGQGVNMWQQNQWMNKLPQTYSGWQGNAQMASNPFTPTDYL